MTAKTPSENPLNRSGLASCHHAILPPIQGRTCTVCADRPIERQSLPALSAIETISDYVTARSGVRFTQSERIFHGRSQVPESGCRRHQTVLSRSRGRRTRQRSCPTAGHMPRDLIPQRADRFRLVTARPAEVWAVRYAGAERLHVHVREYRETHRSLRTAKVRLVGNVLKANISEFKPTCSRAVTPEQRSSRLVWSTPTRSESGVYVPITTLTATPFSAISPLTYLSDRRHR
jgi:hypothetical protein